MDVLTRFGVGSIESYTFVQAHQAEYQDNFGNPVQQGVRVPGKDGVITPYGLGRAPMEAGNVRASFWIHGDYAVEVGQYQDDAKKMAAWGTRRLFKTHRNGLEMWTWASLSSFQAPQVVRRMPHLRQQVQLTFQCPEATWYRRDGMLFYDDDHEFDDGLSFPNVKLDAEVVSDGSTPAVTNEGNAPVSAYVRWDGNGSDSFSNPVITRKNWLGEVVDQLTYTDTIGANDVVEIDARSFKCTDISKLTVTSGAWLTIPPGTWTLEIGGTFTTNGLLTVDFWDAWW